MDDTQAPVIYEFHMDRWLPTTIPMKRFAEYLDKLSELLGHQDGVHFLKVKNGSTSQAFFVDESYRAQVWGRLQAANDNAFTAVADLVSLKRDINRMLMQDHCTGYLRIQKGPKVIVFPGRKTPLAEEVVLLESGDIEGMVIKVGGRDATVPVHLQSGTTFYKCLTSRENAKRLAQRLFEGEVRVTGKGKWLRDAEGDWTLQKFDIVSFEILECVPLDKFVEEMRYIKGSGWNELEDPQAELKRQRED